jgi:hypothetical protein
MVTRRAERCRNHGGQSPRVINMFLLRRRRVLHSDSPPGSGCDIPVVVTTTGLERGPHRLVRLAAHRIVFGNSTWNHRRDSGLHRCDGAPAK